MNRASDGYDGRRFAYQPFAFFGGRNQARVCKPSLSFAYARKVRDVLFRRDDRDYEGAALGGDSRLMNRDARRSRIESFEVISYLRPVSKLAIIARRKSKHVARRRHAG